VSGLRDVAAAAGGLTLTDRTLSGTVPAINDKGRGGFGGSGSGSSGSGSSSGGQSFRANFTTSTFGVDGVDIGSGELGPLSSGKLAVAQKLAGLKNDVNTIYAAASNSSAIGTVSAEIAKALPGDTVTTSSDLASEVTGSLASASSLASNLGKWLAVSVLVAAFLLASLLTMAAVSRRVREFGTLKALGWKSRRIIGQVMGEAVALGVLGGAVGVGLGLAGAELVSKLSPKLSAVVGQTTGSATPGGSRQFGFGPGRRSFPCTSSPE
jgi:ABC-type antimicrobial peptide transport system permease subunit